MGVIDEKTYALSKKYTEEHGGGGDDSSLTADVTSNLAVGAIPSGTTLLKGTTLTELFRKLLITEITPTVIIYEDNTEEKYKLGVENGLLYFEEVAE